MSDTKMSKRQQRRAQRQKMEQRNRMLTIGAIVIGAVLLALALILPNLRPIGEIVSIEPQSRPMADANRMGDPNASIQIEEFSDFRCSFCRSFYIETEGQLVDEYVSTGQVYFIYRSFGSFLSAESGTAAQAAYCAGDQGKFWEMHDIIFANFPGENTDGYSDRRLAAFAEELGLDIDAYNSCFNSGKYSDQVQDDFNDGRAYGVQATPSFVLTYTVDGQTKTRLIQGAQPFSQFQQEIEAVLAEMGQ